MKEQLPLKIDFDRGCSLENFFEAGNQAALRKLRLLISEYSSYYMLWLCAAHGAGKSHLAQALCAEYEARGKVVIYIAFQELVDFISAGGYDPLWVDSLTSADLLCFDDLELLDDLPTDQKAYLEEQLFGLINQNLLNQHQCLVFTSVQLPHQLNLVLKDLLSRLDLFEILKLQAFDEEQSLAFIQFKAKKVGLELEEKVAEFLLKRVARDPGSLSKVIDKLDRFSLATTRKLTIPAVKEALSL